MCDTYKAQHTSYEWKKNKLEPAIIWKLVTCQRITSKRYSTSMGRHLSPRYGQVILVSGYPVLTAVNWSQHWCTICVQYQSPCAPNLVARKCEIEHWFPCGADGGAGGRAVYGHVITKFSWMGSFTYPCFSAGALLAPELRYKIAKVKSGFWSVETSSLYLHKARSTRHACIIVQHMHALTTSYFLPYKEI